MVEIRRIDTQKGDVTTTVPLQQAIQQVEQAITEGELVINETDKQKHVRFCQVDGCFELL